MTTEQANAAGTTQNTGTDAQAAGASAAAAANTQQTQQASTEQGGQNPAGAEQGAGSNAEGQGGQKPAGAPEKYEFQAPEGVTLDADVIGEFEASARELNLTQEAAQKLVEKMAPKLAQSQAAQVEAAKKSWGDAARADKEYGGDALDANLAIAEKGLETFGTPELKTLLKQSGLSHHPEVIRLLYRAGKAVKEDGHVQGSPTGTGKDAKSFYSNSNMNP